MQETEWFTVVAWQKLAEQVNQYLSKGRRTYVDGRLHSYTYQGNDGQMRSRNEITANRVLFLDRAGSGVRKTPPPARTSEVPITAPVGLRVPTTCLSSTR